MKGHLVHEEGLRFRAIADETAEIRFDAGDRETRRGPSPVQGALLSVMACTAADVVLILQKQRVRLTSLEIDAEADRASEDPKVFTKIRITIAFAGQASPTRPSRGPSTFRRRSIARWESCCAVAA